MNESLSYIVHPVLLDATLEKGVHKGNLYVASGFVRHQQCIYPIGFLISKGNEDVDVIERGMPNKAHLSRYELKNQQQGGSKRMKKARLMLQTLLSRQRGKGGGGTTVRLDPPPRGGAGAVILV